PVPAAGAAVQASEAPAVTTGSAPVFLSRPRPLAFIDRRGSLERRRTPHPGAMLWPRQTRHRGVRLMASLVKDLVEAGIHFGHRATNWNPKMAPYIFGKRNKIHIIDVKETIKGLLLARKYITKTVAEGKDVL